MKEKEGEMAQLNGVFFAPNPFADQQPLQLLLIGTADEIAQARAFVPLVENLMGIEGLGGVAYGAQEQARRKGEMTCYLDVPLDRRVALAVMRALGIERLSPDATQDWLLLDAQEG